MEQKYFDWEYVFDFIWQHCDRDGLWDGDAASVAAEFHASEETTKRFLISLTEDSSNRFFRGSTRLRSGISIRYRQSENSRNSRPRPGNWNQPKASI